MDRVFVAKLDLRAARNARHVGEPTEWGGSVRFHLRCG